MSQKNEDEKKTPTGTQEQPGSGAGSFTEPGTFTPTLAASGDGAQFDHEKLDVYRVAREAFALIQPILKRRLPRDSRDQLDRASLSILANIAEGAGKTAWSDKQRFYEIARGSTTETASILDTLELRGAITAEQYAEIRSLLLRVAQMLSRLTDGPRKRAKS